MDKINQLNCNQGQKSIPITPDFVRLKSYEVSLSACGVWLLPEMEDISDFFSRMLFFVTSGRPG